MNLKVTRKRDSQTFTGVKSLTITRKGHFFSRVHVDIRFGKDAFTKYMSKERDISWEINPAQTPGMGIDLCEKIEIFEEIED